MKRATDKLRAIDWAKFRYNSIKFSAPFLLVFLLAIQSGKSIEDALYVLYLYGLNVAIDFLTKFKDANPQ